MHAFVGEWAKLKCCNEHICLVVRSSPTMKRTPQRLCEVCCVAPSIVLCLFKVMWKREAYEVGVSLFLNLRWMDLQVSSLSPHKERDFPSCSLLTSWSEARMEGGGRCSVPIM